ncbi:MAG: hypothetical protein ACYCYE_10405 [Clostridia bacterium]
MNIVTILTTLFATKNAIKGLIIEPLKRIDSYAGEQDYQDVKELSYFWKQEKVPYGTIVNIEGIFSEYSHTFMPHTFTPYIPVNVSHSMDSATVGRIGWKSALFQPPVETIPEVEFDGKNFRLGFLYPHGFSGFTYEAKYNSLQEAINLNDSFLHIPETAKPIPIIYKSDGVMNTGVKYKIKAKVIEIPYANLALITDSLGGLLAPIHELSINLLSPTQKTLCLLVNQESTHFKQMDTYSNDAFPMSFYVEGHIGYSGVLDNIYELIDNAVPNKADIRAPFNSLSFTDSNVYIKKALDRVGDLSERTVFLTTGEVRILFREPGIIGFYVPLGIDNSIYKNRVNDLALSIKNFDRIIQSSTNYKAKFYVDFISDKRLISLMNLPRVLQSKEIQKVVSDNTDFQDTRTWLTNDN